MEEIMNNRNQEVNSGEGQSVRWRKYLHTLFSLQGELPIGVTAMQKIALFDLCRMFGSSETSPISFPTEVTLSHGSVIWQWKAVELDNKIFSIYVTDAGLMSWRYSKFHKAKGNTCIAGGDINMDVAEKEVPREEMLRYLKKLK